nr:hypothetical protein [Tanacetum cinerariifolium]
MSTLKEEPNFEGDSQNDYLWFVSKDDWDRDTPRGDRADGVQIVISVGQYQGVFEHMAEVYSVPLQGAYNPPRYAQLQYDQYYQQYPPPPPQYQQQQDNDE